MKKLLTDFRKDFEEVTKDLERKYGFEIKLGNISYSSDGASFEGKIHAIKVEEGKTGEQIKFEKECESYGFTPQDYKKEYIVDNKKYLLVGFKPKATVNKYIIEDAQTGEKYNCNSGFLGIGKLTYKDVDVRTVQDVQKDKDKINDEKRKDFEDKAPIYGFKPEDYKKEFSKDGKIYQLVGFNTRARKNVCIIIDVETNKEYACPKGFIS